MTSLEKICAAIQRAQQDGNFDALYEALAALAELERAATVPVAIVVEVIETFGFGRKRHTRSARWHKDVPVGTELYTAQPPAQPAPGMFTAEEMTAAYDEGCGATPISACAIARWKESTTYKLIKDRT